MIGWPVAFVLVAAMFLLVCTALLVADMHYTKLKNDHEYRMKMLEQDHEIATEVDDHD